MGHDFVAKIVPWGEVGRGGGVPDPPTSSGSD